MRAARAAVGTPMRERTESPLLRRPRDRQNHHESRLGDDAIDDAQTVQSDAPVPVQRLEERCARNWIVVDLLEDAPHARAFLISQSAPLRLDALGDSQTVIPHGK